MRWIAAIMLALGVVAAVGFYFEERELPDVVWEEDSPYCPHCRTDVNWYATVCYTCRFEFDWKPGEIDCELCFSKLDTDWLRECMKDDPGAYRAALEESFRDLAMPPDVVAATIPDFILYVENIGGGDCAFCAGTGRWLAPAMMHAMTAGDDPLLTIAIEEMDETCPVCLGTGKCIGCGGDRRTLQGVEAARLDSEEANARLADLDPHRDRASGLEFVRLVRKFVERHAGTVEVFDISSLYSIGQDQMDWAAARLDLVRSVLASEVK
jgi:hypothetical protein